MNGLFNPTSPMDAPPIPERPAPLVVTALRTNGEHPKTQHIIMAGRDLVVAGISPFGMVFARAGKTFFASFMTFWPTMPIVQSITGATAVAPNDIWSAVKMAALLSLIPTIGSIGTTLVILFSKLDQKYPSLQA